MSEQKKLNDLLIKYAKLSNEIGDKMNENIKIIYRYLELLEKRLELLEGKK